MFKTVHIVRTVLLCLALCDMCWTRYLAINEETDEFVPDADAEVRPLCRDINKNFLKMLKLILLTYKNIVITINQVKEQLWVAMFVLLYSW